MSKKSSTFAPAFGFEERTELGKEVGTNRERL